jgi:glycosyltransferase involved in cell wall biosynthesis
MLPRVLHLQSGNGFQGGVASYISSLVTSHYLQGYEHHVAVPELSKSEPSLAGELAAMYPQAKLFYMPESYNVGSLNTYCHLLKDAIQRTRPALIHAHALRSGFAASVALCKRMGVRFVYTNHGLRFRQLGTGPKRWLLAQVERYVCSRADAIVFIRARELNASQSLFISRPDRQHLIPTRLSIRPDNTEKRNDTPPVVIGIGSLLEVKRPDIFIDWVAAIQRRYPTVEAVWAGEGPLRSFAIDQARRRGAQINFIGHLQTEGLRQLYRRASLLLLTSDYESFSLAAHEAMALGTPIIARSFPDADQIVQHGSTGLILATDNADTAGALIGELLASPEQLYNFGNNAHERYMKFFYGADSMARDYDDLYQKLISV